MRLKEYLSKIKPYDDVTIIKARAREDARTPFYHAEYQTTPIYTASDWLKNTNENLLNGVILNDKQPPIDWITGSQWGQTVKAGRLKCLLVASQEDFALLVRSKEQRDSMEKYIDERIDI